MSHVRSSSLSRRPHHFSGRCRVQSLPLHPTSLLPIPAGSGRAQNQAFCAQSKNSVRKTALFCSRGAFEKACGAQKALFCARKQNPVRKFSTFAHGILSYVWPGYFQFSSGLGRGVSGIPVIGRPPSGAPSMNSIIVPWAVNRVLPMNKIIFEELWTEI